MSTLTLDTTYHPPHALRSEGQSIRLPRRSSGPHPEFPPPLPEGSPGKPLTGARAVAPKGAPEAVLGQCTSYLLDTPPKPVPLTPEDRRPRGAPDRKAFHRRSGILSNPCATTLP